MKFWFLKSAQLNSWNNEEEILENTWVATVNQSILNQVAVRANLVIL